MLLTALGGCVSFDVFGGEGETSHAMAVREASESFMARLDAFEIAPWTPNDPETSASVLSIFWRGRTPTTSQEDPFVSFADRVAGGDDPLGALRSYLRDDLTSAQSLARDAARVVDAVEDAMRSDDARASQACPRSCLGLLERAASIVLQRDARYREIGARLVRDRSETSDGLSQEHDMMRIAADALRRRADQLAALYQRNSESILS